MKKIIVALMLVGGAAHAEPWQKVYGTHWYPFSSPVTGVGACADPKNVGNSAQCSTLALTWGNLGPLQMGLLGGYEAGGAIANGVKPVLGPYINAGPAALLALDGVVDKVAPGTTIANDIDKFVASPANAFGVSAGPLWRPPLWHSDKGQIFLYCGAYYKFGAGK